MKKIFTTTFVLLAGLGALSGCSSQKNGQSIDANVLHTAQIIDGETLTDKDSWTKRVVGVYSTSEDGQGGLCTGTPISKTVILTAAHCFTGKTKFYAMLGTDLRHRVCNGIEGCSIVGSKGARSLGRR